MNPAAMFFNDPFMKQNNVALVHKKVQEIIAAEFENPPQFERQGIVNIMAKTISDKYEDIEKMNRRAVMNAVNDFRNFQHTARKYNMYADHYVNNVRMYDPTAQMLMFDYKGKNPDHTASSRIRFSYSQFVSL